MSKQQTSDSYAEHLRLMDEIRVQREARKQAEQKLEQTKQDNKKRTNEIRYMKETRLAQKEARLMTQREQTSSMEAYLEEIHTLKEQMKLLQHRLDEVEIENHLIKEAVCVYGV